MKHLDKMLLALCMLLFPFLGAKAFDVPDCATYVDGKNFCYMEVPSTWAPYIWAWEDGGGNLYAAWPGSNADLTQVGTNGANAVYRWTEPSTSTITVTTFICSNNGGDKLGGGNLDFVNGGYYTADDIQAVITATGVTDPTRPTGDLVTVYFDNSTANWETPHIHYWGNKSPEWPGVPMTLYKDKVWKYDCPKGTTDCLFNAGDGDRTKTGDMVVKNGHIYNTSGDLGEYNGSVITDPDPVPDTKYYAMHGNMIGGSWASTLLTDDDNDGWYSVAATFQAGEFGIKVLKSADNIQGTADQIDWIGGGADITEADKVYSMAGTDNSKGSLEGAYIFSFNPETKEAKMTANGVNPDPDPNPDPNPEYPELTIVGSMNDWAIASGIKMTREGDTYTATLGDLDAKATFKVAVPGAEWTRSWGGEGVIDPDVTGQVATVTLGSEMNAWEGSSVNFYVADALKDAVVTFKYSGDDKTVASKLTMTGTVVENPDPDPDPTPETKYYAMHGDIIGGSWASTLLTDDDNDGWYSVAATFQAGEFGIKVLKSTDNIQGTADQIAWIGGGADITEADKVYSMAGDDNSWNALEGAYIFSFNPETKEAKMTVNGVGPDPDPEYPDGLVVVGTMNDWTLAAGIFLTREGDTYTAEVGDLEADTEFKIAVIGEEWTRSWGGQGVIDPDVTEQVATVTPGVEMNAWEGSSVNFYISEEIKDAVITFKYAGADKSVPSKITVTGASEPDPRPVVPDNLYLVGDLASGSWNISAPQAMAKNGNEFSATNVEFVKGEGSQMSFFSFITATGADWDADVNSHDRYGSPSPNAMVVIGAPAPVKRYAAGVDASAAASWVVTPGTYDVTVDFDHMFVTLTRSTVGIDGVDSESGDTYYFDFNGMPVAKPASGQMYIVRKGAKVSKEIIR